MRRSLSVTVMLSLLAGVVGALGWWMRSRDAAPPPPPAHPNVLVLLLDTLRADHLGAYGYERATSPNMDRLAREGLRFSRAFCATPWTPPSVANVFSGLYSTSHGMVPLDKSPLAEDLSRRLDEGVLTLAEILHGAGYQTAAVSANPWITPEFGFGQGFDSFDLKSAAWAETITDAGLARIDQLRASGGPFLLYMHYFDPHAPYTPPKEHMIFQGQPLPGDYGPWAVNYLDRYDGEIHYLDTSLGRLFSELRAKGLYDDLVIVLVGDHGEQFGEHGQSGHGWQLFNEELRVPLVVKPGRASESRVIDRVVSTIDILPTILGRTGQAMPATLQGVDLLDDGALAARRGVFAEIDRAFSQRAYVDAKGKKLIVGSRQEGEAFDPAEFAGHIVGVFDATLREEPRIEDAELERTLAGRLREILDAVARAKITPVSSPLPLSEETIRRLEAVGYVK